MFGVIKWFIVNIFNLLPDSPFSDMLDTMEVDRSYFQYMNWFLPFDNIGNIMLAWVDCMLAYLVFLIIKFIIMKIIVTKLSEVGELVGMIGGGG